MTNQYDLCVVGGAGHVGSVLSILFASKGQRVLIYDLNVSAMNSIESGILPFLDNGYEPYLKKALEDNNLFFTNKPDEVKNAKTIVITIGTNVDEFRNPRIHDVIKCINDLPIHSEQLLILRSTIYPGVSGYVSRYLKDKGVEPMIAFCPERIVQGNATKEIQELPQIVSGITKKAQQEAAALFSLITDKIVYLEPMEAEFAKLFANCYRYIQFAATNQFYEMATTAGLDYGKILSAVKEDYPRLRDLPSPGLAAGSCLYKDSLQLCAYYQGKFMLGEAAVQANEGLPAFLVSQLEEKFDGQKDVLQDITELSEMTVGLLGMSFKADSDDTRTSLSYKLKKLLQFKAKQVLTTDPLVETDPNLLPLDEVIDKSHILIVCVPHAAYKELDFKDKYVVNIWKNK
jgi:UDP-N-acetyl-D-mannosaminuronic acid dehydrogenase